MKYISYYKEYPIYEPAEGGYYYSGNQLIESERKSERACKKNLFMLWEECKQDNISWGFTDDNQSEWDEISKNTHEYPWYFDKKNNRIFKQSRYIGGGEYYIIEKRQGSYESGYKPYC